MERLVCCASLPLCNFFAVTRMKTMGAVHKLWRGEAGQDIAEYAIMLAVILAIAVGTIRLIGSSAGNVFSSVASAVQ